MPSGWSDSSTERFSGWDIIPTQVPKFNLYSSDQSLCPLCLEWFFPLIRPQIYSNLALLIFYLSLKMG
jgi:hypothetical protein